MRITVAIALFAAATGAAAAQQTQSQPSQPNQQSHQATAPRANQSITVTGCLAAGTNNAYTLTVAPDDKGGEPVTGSTATTPVGSKVAKTVTYTLAGSNTDLKSHVGHMVQVTGVEQAPEMNTKTTDTRSGAAGTAGTSGSNAKPGTATSPKVQTTEQTQIVLRQLDVKSVKMVAAKCDLIK